MANPGVGNKFVSVNLNKSYGQHAQHHQGNSYGQSRTRGSGHGSGGGGGMVVLSRPRSSQKAGPKLSVPPPLNLPSLRKEHEKFDTLGATGSAAGGGVSGSGMRPGSSGMGWTKPVNVGLQEKEVSGSGDKGVSGAVDLDMHSAVDALNKGGSAYMPPSARSGPVASAYRPVEKATVLRGEDFPSLRAAVPAGSGSSQRQKDGLNPKQKHLSGEDTGNEQRPSSHMSALVDMRPQVSSSRHIFANGVHENGDENHTFGSSRMSEQSRKQDDYFSGPLPLVPLNPRSDWADDERDTSRGLIERGRDSRDIVFSKSEAYWDGDFDMPKASFLPHKPAHSSLDRWGQRDNETGKYSSSEVHRADPHGRDVGISGGEGREGGSWRVSSPIPKGGAGVQESRNERNNLGVRSSILSMETKKDNKHISSPFRDGAPHELGRKDIDHGQGGKLSWNSNFDSFNNRGAERIARDRNGSEQFAHYPVDGLQNSSASKSSSGGKGPPVNDSILNFTKDKRPFSKNEKPYLEDPFLKDYGDGRDPLSGSLVGVVKRKKDMLKQTDFYDPVRESFEAELERVQKVQEQERQRILEEQERALEFTRREEEERARLAREQEEMQRRLEEEAKEAAWRAEQERLEALHRAEEQRIAREEEKRRLLLEEERRKQAAKQKLLELEERIAKRRAETVRVSGNSFIAGERYAASLKEKDTSRVADTGDWEDSENMVERIATPASSDSSTFNRTFDMGTRQNISRDSSISVERGKPSNSWRRDPFETGNSSTFGLAEQEGVHNVSKRDASHGGRTLQRKEFSGAGYVSYRSHNKGGLSEPQMDDFIHNRGHRWNLVDGDPVNRNPELDPEFHENFNESFAGDVGWGHSQSHGYTYPQSSEQFYQNSEADGSYSYGRSRYSMRQPRVLPPPSLSSLHKNARGGEIEHPRPSSFLDSEMHHIGSVRSGSSLNVGHQEDVDHELLGVEKESTDEQKLDPQTAPRCDSQSSLSVSSPPDSPIHLSHDDLDESGDYSVKSATGQNGDLLIPEREAVVLPTKAGPVANAPRSISSEDEGEWTEENNELLQEQEEYDEDEEGYQEEDEVREADDEIGDRHQEFDGIHLENESSAGLVDNLVLGFNEGVEVPVPSDEYEQSPRNREVAYAGRSVSLGHGQEKESSVRQSSDVLTGRYVDGSSQSSMDASSRLLQDAEKAMQGLVIKVNNLAVTSTASQILDDTDAPIRHVVPSSSNLMLHSTASAVAAQAEVPKLQFGLFSGPSLIPSPVPAIQIGSIQMPLHLHPQVAPCLSPMQQAHPPIFQFGQLRYSSAFPPGIVSMASQPVSLVQPNVPANFPFNQSQDGSLLIQPSQDIRVQNVVKMDDASLSAECQPGIVQRHSILPEDKSMKNLNPLPAREKVGGMLTVRQDQAENSLFLEGNNVPNFQLEEPDQQNEGGKNYKFMSNSKKWEGQGVTGVPSSQSIRKEKDFNGSRAHGSVNGGKVYVFKVKNPASRSPLPESEVSQSDSSGYQRRQRCTVRRTEFRVRENSEKRRSAILGSPSLLGLDDRSSINVRSTVISGRTCSGKAVSSSKLPKRTFEPESFKTGSMNTQEMESRRRNEKRSLKESIPKSQSVHQPLSLEQIPKSNVHEEDIDAPLQSGIVRVFQQPGIEAPSDEDDFIEVRSKRQMLNDKREQREKEIKAKSHVAKVPRKSRSLQNTDFPTGSKRISSLRSGETATAGHADFATADGRGLASIEVSDGFSASMGSQPLAPIGTPAAKTETLADSVPQKIMSLTADIGKNLGSGSIFESKNKVMDNVQTLDSWRNSGINQQVMSLTQSQLDEAMKPVKFDARGSVGETSYTVTEGSVPLTSISAKDKSFSSATSPINSLLAGEKIQFGAVTSPTVLPPSSHALSHGIGPPNSCLLDVQVSHKLSADEDGCNIFFDKNKNTVEPCVPLEDSEAEAEAAASAVAVAAISSDEIVGNGLGRSVSVSDAKNFGAVDVGGISAGTAVDQESANHLRAEEPLTVSLPADLSVETPPISLWQPLTSSQSTSSQMLSHFPGGPPSHFPFFEMNPMMGSPIFAFGPSEESASTQQQSQKSSAPNLGTHGSWPQCHSGVDSFYGRPAGYTGPFISPGGIPGVQGPPHMVVYNHFAPVGLGRVGLSFMGTTFIPSGRQPDWKHNPASAAMVGEGDMNNMNVVPAQRNLANMPAPIQHLAPGSPLLPMASPMFDVPPFQTNPEMSAHARWAHVPAPLQSSSMSLPMQQQAGALPPKFINGPSVDQSLSANRFVETCTSSPESSRNFPVATDASANRLPDDLGLLDPSGSSSGASTQNIIAKNLPLNASIEAGNVNHHIGGDNDGCSSETSAVFDNKSSQQRSISSQNYSSSSGYNYPRGGLSQKGNEWPHRRAGFQGRNHSFGSEKSFASNKVKQIYVAKQTISGKTAT